MLVILIKLRKNNIINVVMVITAITQNPTMYFVGLHSSIPPSRVN